MVTLIYLICFFYLINNYKYANKRSHQIVCLCLNLFAVPLLFFYHTAYQRYNGFPKELCILGVDKFSASVLGGCHGNEFEVHVFDSVCPIPGMFNNDV